VIAGHSRPKDGAASLAYGRSKDIAASLAYIPAISFRHARQV
jgi:hypothetical protein